MPYVFASGYFLGYGRSIFSREMWNGRYILRIYGFIGDRIHKTVSNYELEYIYNNVKKNLSPLRPIYTANANLFILQDIKSYKKTFFYIVEIYIHMLMAKLWDHP